MRYIPDVDELFVAPPYNLGTVYANQGMEAHHLTLAADHRVLQDLVDSQLNAALPTKKARLKTTGTDHGVFEIVWKVPTEVVCVDLSFVRYWRIDSRAMPKAGWTSYTEALIQFIVKRTVVGKDAPPDAPSEAFYFVGAVYIDDSAFTGQVQDPQPGPIVVGREGYGMPKAPGQISYSPAKQDPGNPRLQVWHNPGTNKLELTDAIVFNPSTMTLLACLTSAVSKWFGPARAKSPSKPPVPRTSLAKKLRYGLLARQLNMEPDKLIEALSTPEPETLPPPTNITRPRWASSAKKLALQSGDILLWDDQRLLLSLVGLKQFPDPTSVWDPKALDPFIDACYQAIVETPIEIEDDPENQPVWWGMSSPQEIWFPKVPNGVDLLESFGITPDKPNGRIVSAEALRGEYTNGPAVFANPYRTVVWEPV